MARTKQLKMAGRRKGRRDEGRKEEGGKGKLMLREKVL